MAPSLATSRRAPPPHPSEIERWREEIDHVDRVLVRLLSLRARLALKIAGSKRAAGLPLHAPARERDVLANVAAANLGPLDGRAVQAVFRLVIRESRRLEQDHFSTPQ
ncbi:MAG TPA: chorismate mutase [Gemmatimonadales bacterium]|nr:chorismate mutase [Gemmatimonadales bacterium]